MKLEAAARALGISPAASDVDVNRAFRRCSKLHHPDKGGSTELFNEIKAAREKMLDSGSWFVRKREREIEDIEAQTMASALRTKAIEEDVVKLKARRTTPAGLAIAAVGTSPAVAIAAVGTSPAVAIATPVVATPSAVAVVGAAPFATTPAGAVAPAATTLAVTTSAVVFKTTRSALPCAESVTRKAAHKTLHSANVKDSKPKTTNASTVVWHGKGLLNSAEYKMTSNTPPRLLIEVVDANAAFSCIFQSRCRWHPDDVPAELRRTFETPNQAGEAFRSFFWREGRPKPTRIACNVKTHICTTVDGKYRTAKECEELASKTKRTVGDMFKLS